MNKGTCKNCGGDYGIHRWDTFQCPFGGREANFPRKTEYINSYYEEDSSEIEDKLATLAIQNKELIEALERYIKAMPQSEIELAREAWGNTNTRIVSEARDNAIVALAKVKQKGG